MAKENKVSKQWTKTDLKKFLSLWESKTGNQLAKEFGVSRNYINAIATKFRKNGFALPKKRAAGVLDGLIKEVISEIK